MFCSLTHFEIAISESPVCGLDQRKKMEKAENVLQSQVENYLLKTGWVKCGMIEKKIDQNIKGMFIRVPNEAFGRDRNVKDWLANFPDLCLYHPDGRYFMPELKAKTGEKSKGQKALAKVIPVYEGKILEDVLKKIEVWYLNLPTAGDNTEHF